MESTILKAISSLRFSASVHKLYVYLFVFLQERERDCKRTRERKPYCLIVSSELNRCVNRDRRT